MNKSEIARRLNISRPTIIDWLEKKEYEDERGWKEGTKRTHTDTEEDRIVELKQKRIDEKKFFLGAPHIQMDYSKLHPNDPLPSLWFMNETFRRHNLQTHEPKKRTKGQNIVARLKFPIKSIITLGLIQQASDFIGKKFIKGRTEPISIFSTSYYQQFQLYQIWRVCSETAESAVTCLRNLWQTTPVPHVMRIDNGMTFRGTGRGESHIGRFVKFLLNTNVTPLFSAPYQSYTNPHVEGHNCTFTEKVWSKNFFTSEEEIDRECDRFNTESREYFEYAFKERMSERSLRYLASEEQIPSMDILRSTKGKKICFIRYVERWNERDRTSGVVVLNRFVSLPESFVNQYVFVILNLETASLSVRSEDNGVLTEILCQQFPFTV